MAIHLTFRDSEGKPVPVPAPEGGILAAVPYSPHGDLLPVIPAPRNPGEGMESLDKDFPSKPLEQAGVPFTVKK